MSKPIISIISAVADNNVIGSNNDLIWHISEDLKRFKEITTGKTVVMGKRTFESIVKRLDKPLPNRKNIVLTKPEEKINEDVVVVHDIESVLNLNDEEVIIIGGGQVYAQFLPLADRLYITHVHQSPEGDVKFPEVNWSEWKETYREDHEGFSFVNYERL